MAKTFGAAASKSKTVSAPVAQAPAKAEKTEYTPKANDFGAFKNIPKKDGTSMQAIEVTQDMTLTKGQLIVFQSLDDELQWLVDNGHITEEVKAERTEKLSFLIGKFRTMAPKN